MHPKPFLLPGRTSHSRSSEGSVGTEGLAVPDCGRTSPTSRWKWVGKNPTNPSWKMGWIWWSRNIPFLTLSMSSMILSHFAFRKRLTALIYLISFRAPLACGIIWEISASLEEELAPTITVVTSLSNIFCRKRVWRFLTALGVVLLLRPRKSINFSFLLGI